MKSNYLLVSVIFVGLTGLSGGAFAEQGYPADAEASYDLPAIQTYAERNADAVWGVSPREVTPHDPFPFGGGFIDD